MIIPLTWGVGGGNCCVSQTYGGFIVISSERWTKKGKMANIDGGKGPTVLRSVHILENVEQPRQPGSDVTGFGLFLSQGTRVKNVRQIMAAQSAFRSASMVRNLSSSFQTDHKSF